jgi:hypothetical protein
MKMPEPILGHDHGTPGRSRDGVPKGSAPSPRQKAVPTAAKRGRTVIPSPRILPRTTMKTPEPIFDAARGYAERNLPIIPLRGKLPAIKGWQAFVANRLNVRLWWGGRMALA